MKYKAIIFDCFGVLYPNHADGFEERHKEFLANNSAFMDQLNLDIDLGKVTQADAYERLAKAMSSTSAKVQTEMEARLVVDPKIVNVIRELKKKYKIGLLSNAGSEEIAVISRDGLEELFDATAISYEVGFLKPSPIIYKTCLERLHVRPQESVFVDDRMLYLEAANKLGMHTIHYSAFGVVPSGLLELL